MGERSWEIRERHEEGGRRAGEAAHPPPIPHSTAPTTHPHPHPHPARDRPGGCRRARPPGWRCRTAARCAARSRSARRARAPGRAGGGAVGGGWGCEPGGRREAGIWRHGGGKRLPPPFQPTTTPPHAQPTLPYSPSLPASCSEPEGWGAVALGAGAGAAAPAPPQRPQDAAQKPPSAIQASPHLPQAACCWQAKPSGVGRLVQAPPSAAGAARKGGGRERRRCGERGQRGGSERGVRPRARGALMQRVGPSRGKVAAGGDASDGGGARRQGPTCPGGGRQGQQARDQGHARGPHGGLGGAGASAGGRGLGWGGAQS